MSTKLPPFQLLYPMTWNHRVSARFDDPVNYSGQPRKVQRREGMLFVPLALQAVLEVRAAQRGVVEEVSFSQQGYGNYVRIAHEWYGAMWKTWYGHLDRVEVHQGDFVNAGDVIGLAGRSGSATSVCLFLTVQQIGKGKPNYVVDDVVDPQPLLFTILRQRDEAWWDADVTIVDGSIMKPGERFRKTWRIRNAGTTTWASGYTMAFFDKEKMGDGQSVPLPAAAPGQLVEVSVDLTAPQQTGLKRSTWMPRTPQGEYFPHEMYAEIDVRQPEQVSGKSVARFVSDVTLPDGARVTAGQKLRKTWRIHNDGETTWGVGYELAFIKDEQMSAPLSVALPSIRPGQQGEISIDIVAPTAPGRHKTTWQPRDPQGRFFPFEFYADIDVVATSSGDGGIETGSCNAAVRRDIRAKLREAPTKTSKKLVALEPSTPVQVLGVTKDEDVDGYRWIRGTALGQTGFIREDLLTYASNCAGLDLPVSTDGSGSGGSGETPNPIVRYETPVRGAYRLTTAYGSNGHKGTDMAGAIGIPITAGGDGVVARAMRCTQCSDAAPNFASHGIAFWDPDAIADPAWGYGFGNHVIVRYAWNALPGQLRQYLLKQNLGGAYAYVVYGHLHRINVAEDSRVTLGTTLGTLGNTGNSTGPHLHVEVRVTLEPNLKSIFQRLVVNPSEMFEL
jgi:murein DD-endopeptidase MepM/ murein hydrolase activator NlpD